MKLNKESVLKAIKAQTNRPMKLKELAHELSVPNSQYPEFRAVIKSLTESGELVKLKRNRIGLASELDVSVGKIEITRSGVGFLITPEGQEDIMIPQWHLGTALDGDDVMVRLGGKSDGRQTGTVIKVTARSGRNIIGTFHESRNLPSVKADNPRIHRDLYIPPDKTLDARDGEKVVAQLYLWDDPHRNPEGVITERLGFPGEPGVDMKTVIRMFNLPDAFPPEVIEAAEDAAVLPEKSELTDRVDLTQECIYTIDPEDAKDHDDAVNVSRTKTGYTLGVHIADVSHYVQAGSILDKEAFERGNSVYLPGMVIPMLPEILSADVCSLKPNRLRLAHSIEMNFDKRGKLIDWKVFNSVIKSAARLSYEDVQSYFDTGEGNERVLHVAENLLVARELALLLNAGRFEAGSLDFDLPEAKIILNADGEVVEIGNRIRMESHRLVEEFMLAANKAVALELFRNGLQLIYRVHDKPDPEKLQHFSEMMARLGYKVPISDDIRPKQLADFLKEIEGSPEEDFINELMLRSMKKAVYQRENVGHFGLAFKHYTHFTSPIRRYPDLLIHRLLRQRKNGKYPAAFAKRVDAIIDRVGSHCSETERNAEQAEREAVKVKQVSFMAQHIGKEFDGVISGVIGAGFFVRLANIFAEGMVRISNIDDDYYRYDEKNYRFVGSRHGRVFQMGQRLRVGVERVDIERREITLYLVEEEDRPKRASSRPPSKSKSKTKPKQVRKKSRRRR